MDDKAPQQEQEGKGLTMDKLFIRGGGSAAVLMMGLMYQSMLTTQQEVAKANTAIVKLTTELEIVSPRDIRRDVQAMSAKLLSRQEIEQIAKRSAPWNDERGAFDNRLRKIEHQVETILERLKELRERIECELAYYLPFIRAPPQASMLAAAAKALTGIN